MFRHTFFAKTNLWANLDDIFHRKSGDYYLIIYRLVIRNRIYQAHMLILIFGAKIGVAAMRGPKGLVPQNPTKNSMKMIK